jgi:hypothetical protein
MTAGASALGRRGHVQEDISSDAPAIAKSHCWRSLRIMVTREVRRASRSGASGYSGEGGSAPRRQMVGFKEGVQSLLNVRRASKDIDMDSFWGVKPSCKSL